MCCGAAGEGMAMLVGRSTTLGQKLNKPTTIGWIVLLKRFQ